MHKRLLTILATITLSTALLVGCGNKQEEIPQATIEESAPEQTEEETTPSTEIAEQTPEVTAEPVEERMGSVGIMFDNVITTVKNRVFPHI